MKDCTLEYNAKWEMHNAWLGTPAVCVAAVPLLSPSHQPHISLPVQPFHLVHITRDTTVLHIARVLLSLQFYYFTLLLRVRFVVGISHHRSYSFDYCFFRTLSIQT